MGSLSDALNSYGIKPEAVLAQSHKLETLQPEDAELYQKRATKRVKATEGTYEKLGIAKPRSGRAVTQKHLTAALAGSRVPAKARAKLTRAINALLKTAGKPAVESKVLFGTPDMKKKEA